MNKLKLPLLLAALAGSIFAPAGAHAADTIMSSSYSIKVDAAPDGADHGFKSLVLPSWSRSLSDEDGLSSADRLELAKYRDSLAFAEREAVREHEIRKERIRKDGYVPAFVGPLAFFGIFILIGVPILGLFFYLTYRTNRRHRQEELRLDTIRELVRSGQPVTSGVICAINNRYGSPLQSAAGHLHQALGRPAAAPTAPDAPATPAATPTGEEAAAEGDPAPDAAEDELALAEATAQATGSLTMQDMEYILKKCLIGILCVVTGYISGVEWFGWILLLVGFYFLAQGGARLWYYHRMEADRRKHKA